MSHCIELKNNIDATLASFPTPIEESRKDLACQYLGCMYVDKPGGMDILRPAVEQVAMDVPEERWVPVKVHISPTSINICSDDVGWPISKTNEDSSLAVS
jgi:hypothetical protein